LAVITDRKALKSPPYLSIFMACDEKNFSWSKMKELAADIYSDIRREYPDSSQYTRKKFAQFDQKLTRKAEMAKAHYCLSDLKVTSAIQQAKIRIIENLKSENKRHAAVERVADKTSDLQANAEVFTDVAKTIKSTAEWQLLQARIYSFCCVVFLLAILGGIAYNMLPGGSSGGSSKHGKKGDDD